MFGKSNLNRFAALTIPAAVALLAGCSSYEKLPEQRFDANYKVFSVTKNTSGNLKYFFIKKFEVDGKLAMCGGYTRASSNLGAIGARKWADISQVYIDGSKIGHSDFMVPMSVYGHKEGKDPNEMYALLLEKSPATNCVKSEEPWQAKFKNTNFERKGPPSVRSFD